MGLYLLFFLILFPLMTALVLLTVKDDRARGIIVKAAAAIIALGSVAITCCYFQSGGEYFTFESQSVSYLMMGIELALAAVIIWLGMKHKKYVVALLAVIQAPLMVWFELEIGHHLPVANNLYVDRFSLIMILIIGIIGSLICVYAVGYMRDFQKECEEHGEGDRRPWFFFLLFLFLGAMAGIVTSNNLIWMYFFWEITSLCSFFLIGYTKTQEAVNNSFRALAMNLLGGLGFVLAIISLGTQYGTLELDQLVKMGASGISVVLPVTLLIFAGVTKAAQMPFSSWLLGAMVAPTPTSALLHSSTMVKAGVFLIIKLTPLLGWNLAGMMTMMIGGITFLMAAFAAISQSNAKKVLAYSTISNLGLIVACAGIGSYAAQWAAIMLVIFHAIAKSLLFLCVGTTEHNIGSRDIEDMDGLFTMMPKVAIFMVVGICGMFLAPFGMLISKWAALKAFLDSGNLILTMTLVFGSAATLFFWAKWMGKVITIVYHRHNIEDRVHREEWLAMTTLTTLTVVICLIFPLVSKAMIIPYLETMYAHDTPLGLDGNMSILCMMVALLVMLPMLFFGRTKKRVVPIYLSGANSGDNLNFQGAAGHEVHLSLRNWYMDSYFNEKRMNLIGNVGTVIVLAAVFSVLLGGIL